MLTDTYYAECEAEERALSEEGRQGNMWSEAKSQCLQSWLECSDDYTDESFADSIMDDLEYLTECWLEGHMSQYAADELKEGSLYHWMVQALEHRYS